MATAALKKDYPALKKDHPIAVDETTPLLVAEESGPPAYANGGEIVAWIDRPGNLEGNGHVDVDGDGGEDEDEDEGPPLPKAQILFLCYARLVEPIAFFSIFPFINQMIAETGSVKPSDVGFYSGLIESLFSLTQMLLMIFWGRAADRFGRKPVLVSSLVGVSVASSLFGLSRSVWQMIVLRCAAGVFAGTIVTIRTMISEHSTPRTQARAFSLFSFFGNLGIFLGPVVGGGLSNPAYQYPSVFGHVKLFREYPYLLPTLCTGTIGASAAIISAVFIDETLKKKKPNDDDTSSSIVEPPMSTVEIIKSPGVGIVLFIYGFAMLLGLAYTAVWPIHMFTPVKLGGYNFTPLEISVVLGAGGFAQAVWTLGVFPPLQHRIGTGGILHIMAFIWPFSFLAHPLLNLFLKWHWRTGFWVGLAMLTLFGAVLSMAFTAVQLALNDIAPSHSTLGTLNAVALALVSGIRAVAPALFASIYAAGVGHQIIRGYLGWVVLAVMALPMIVVLRWLPVKAEGRLKRR